MDNNFSSMQNSSENLNCLAAQRTLYSNAKRITGVQIILSVPVMVFISIPTLILNDKNLSQQIGMQQVDISWIAAFAGVLITLIDLIILAPLVNQIKDKAAKIQELFDCSVLNMPWNDVAVGEKPDFEDINKYSKPIRNNQTELNKLKDWYSTLLDGISYSASRVISQRSNLWWDTELRIAYVSFMTIIAATFFVFLLSIGLYNGLTLKSFFMVVLAPSLPALVLATRQQIENKTALIQLTTLKNLANKVWQELLSMEKDEAYLLEYSRKLQDQIYLNRKSNPLIFNWFYNKRKSKQQDNMCYSIEQLTNEYEAAKSTYWDRNTHR